MDIKTGRYYDTDYISNRKSDDLKKVLLGALAGAAVGSIIGSLYTEKGIETRNRVSYRSKKVANNFKEKASDITGGIKAKVTNITGEIGDKFGSMKDAAAKLFAKRKPKAGIARFSGDYAGEYAGYNDLDIEISKPKVILAALAVTVAGTAVWSFTSEKGKETRKRVGESSKKIAGKIKAKVPEIAKDIKEKYKIAKEAADELLEQEKQKAANQPLGSTGYNGSTNYTSPVTP